MDRCKGLAGMARSYSQRKLSKVVTVAAMAPTRTLTLPILIRTEVTLMSNVKLAGRTINLVSSHRMVEAISSSQVKSRLKMMLL
jgi:hypothetical protein